jgi:hypothetical protein
MMYSNQSSLSKLCLARRTRFIFILCGHKDAFCRKSEEEFGLSSKISEKLLFDNCLILIALLFRFRRAPAKIVINTGGLTPDRMDFERTALF